MRKAALTGLGAMGIAEGVTNSLAVTHKYVIMDIEIDDAELVRRIGSGTTEAEANCFAGWLRAFGSMVYVT